MKKEKAKNPFYKKWWGLLAIIIIASVSGCGDNEETVASSPVKQQKEEEVVKESDNANTEAQETHVEATEAAKSQEEKEPEITKYESGMYKVGTDIEPGLYKSSGSVLYWARLKGFSGELDDIISNGNPVGCAIVEIKTEDKGFQTDGSGYWVKIDDTYNPETITTFGDGEYIVGKDIEPGTYKSEGAASMGYWARVKGFSGELPDIIANGNPTGSIIVEIGESDYGFKTWGNGMWTKIE